MDRSASLTLKKKSAGPDGDGDDTKDRRDSAEAEDSKMPPGGTTTAFAAAAASTAAAASSASALPPSLESAIQGLFAAHAEASKNSSGGGGGSSSTAKPKKRSFQDMMIMSMAAHPAMGAFPMSAADVMGAMDMGGIGSIVPPAAETEVGGGGGQKKVKGGPSSGGANRKARPPPPPLDEASWKKTLERLPRCWAVDGLRETSCFRFKTQSASGQPGSATGYGGPYGPGAGGGRAPGGRMAAASSTQTCLRRLLAELSNLEDDLPENPAIWLAFDEETPQFARALITGPPATPYAFGLFCFDIYVPDAYPQVPPKVQLLTTGGGTVGFSPNLYKCGTVCLSLLGTWHGPKWNPQHSTLLQVLVSIQGLILGVEHPYYLEPGFGGWEGTAKLNTTAPSAATAQASTAAEAGNTADGDDEAKTASTAATTAATSGNAAKGASDPVAAAATKSKSNDISASANTSAGTKIHVPSHVTRHEDRLREGTVKFALLETAMAGVDGNFATSNVRHLKPFQDVIQAHFWHYKDLMLHQVQGWIDDASSPPHGHGAGVANFYATSTIRHLQKGLKLLKQVFAKLQAPTANGSEHAKSEEDEIRAILADSSKDAGAVKEAIVAAKKRSMEEAVKRRDYVAAGRIQAELAHVETGQYCVELKIATKREAMQAAAAKGDFITAGQLQIVVQHLEKNQRRLQELQRRTFEAAAKLDFCRAGRFQEQYRIIYQSKDDDDRCSSSKLATYSPMAAAAASNGASGIGESAAAFFPPGGGGAGSFSLGPAGLAFGPFSFGPPKAPPPVLDEYYGGQDDDAIYDDGEVDDGGDDDEYYSS